MNLDGAERIIGHIYSDKQLLKRALTLPSADISDNNQLLEFFGDAILEFIVSEELFNRNPDATEGELTKLRSALVKDEALAEVSKKLGLDKLLIRGAGDNKNIKAIPSVYEAVIASVFLDGGMDKARAFVKSTLNFNAEYTEEPKSRLNEYLQKKKQSTPDYDECTRSCGTAQAPRYKTEIEIDGAVYSGEGASKKEAQTNCAVSALKGLGIVKKER